MSDFILDLPVLTIEGVTGEVLPGGQITWAHGYRIRDSYDLIGGGYVKVSEWERFVKQAPGNERAEIRIYAGRKLINFIEIVEEGQNYRANLYTQIISGLPFAKLEISAILSEEFGNGFSTKAVKNTLHTMLERDQQSDHEPSKV